MIIKSIDFMKRGFKMDGFISEETKAKLKGSKTEQNLKDAFAGESMAQTKYRMFSDVAKEEGYEQIAEIFMKTAGNEKEHAEVWYKVLHDGLGDTLANLKDAVSGETHEHTSMYPDYAKIAKEEGFDDIAKLFEQAGKIERSHQMRYGELEKNIEEDRVFKKDQPVVWECRNCGYRVYGKEAPERCPFCGYPQGFFELPCHNY